MRERKKNEESFAREGKKREDSVKSLGLLVTTENATLKEEWEENCTMSEKNDERPETDDDEESFSTRPV